MIHTIGFLIMVISSIIVISFIMISSSSSSSTTTTTVWRGARSEAGSLGERRRRKREKMVFHECLQHIALLLQKSSKISGDLRECAAECNLGIPYSSSQLISVASVRAADANACGLPISAREFTKGGLVNGGLAIHVFPLCDCNTLGSLSNVQIENMPNC